VSSKLESLATALQDALGSDSTTTRSMLRRVRQGIAVYDSSGNGLLNAMEQRAGDPLAIQEDALVDLRSLATAIQAEQNLTDTVTLEASALAGAVSGGNTPLVLASSQVSGIGVAGVPIVLNGTGGISVFFPTGVRLGGQPTMVQRYLYGASGEPRDSTWAGFLRGYISSELGSGPGGVTAGPQGGAQLRGPVGGLINLDIFLPSMMQ
jgi:hypothetical protein